MDVDTEDGSDNPWAFGTSAQYPALKAVLDDDQAMWEEFGYQLREGPSLTASTTPGMAQVALSWTAPVVSHWMPAPTVTYTLTRDDGTTRETLATDLSSLQYTDTGVTPGATYTYQLAASVSGGEATRSARVSATVPSTSAPSVSSIAITSAGGYAAGETIEVTVTFTKAVTVTGSPQLTLNVGGEDRTAGYESVTGAAVVFSYTVAAGESDRNGVSIEANSLSLNGGTIRDSTDTTDAVLNHQALADDSQHRVDGVKPELLSTGGAVVNGATLTLSYASPLDQMSVPPASAFTVAGGNSARTVSGVALASSNLYSDRFVVTLTLAPAVEHGETGLRVSYTVPTGMGASPIQDGAGNDAEALSSQPVTNETPEMTAPTVSSIAIASDAGTDRIYVPGDRIEAAVTFSETVKVTGAPQLVLEVGGVNRSATYYGRGSGTVLVFTHTVADGESDTDGVGIEANQLSLNSGTIKDAAENDAVLDHQAVEADTRHRVDGVKPKLATAGGAAVNLATITLTYDEPLDGNSTPPPGAFTVAGGSQTRTVTDVEVSGSAVELTLDAAVDHGETGIKVSYKVPRGVSASPIRDTVRNAAAALTNLAVTNETPDTSPPKVSTISFSSSPGTDRTYAAGEDIEVTVTFSKEVAVTGSPQLTLNVGGTDRTAGHGSVTGAAVTFSYRVADRETDTDGVSIEANSLSLNSGTIKDSTDDIDAVLNHRAVAANAGHKVDGVKPELATAVGAVANGATLTLTYDEPLDGTSMPAASAFTVAGGSQSRTVTGVRVSGSTVELTVDPAVEQAETGIRVSYTVPTGMGASPIRDAVGNAALGLSSEPVINETPDTIAPTVSLVEITSDPGSDRIYAPEDEIQVTVTFSEAVDVERTPRLMLKVGDRNRPAGYLEGTGTTELVFAYEVVNGDEDSDGVSIDANSLSLNGGTIEDAADNSAVLDHDGLAADSGHKVDGAGPDLAETGGAVVDGATLTLTFDEPLDRGSTPQASAFRVTGGDTSRTVTDIALSGSAVLLTLDPAVEHGETGIRVSYTVPTGTGVSPLQDVLGNEADRLSNLPVTNETPDTTPPAVSKLEITSDPGTDRTYAAEDDIQVTVTFSETVEVTGTPRLQIELGGGSRTADYQGGSGTAALVFEYEVADGESDTDGVGVEADSLSGGTIRDEARNNAELDHDGVAADSGHKVDGVKPELAASGGAVVDGTTLTLTYSEPLGGSSTPEAGDFTVTGGDRARTVTRVTVSGSTVVLTLDTAAEHLEAGIQVSYTPGTNPIRDVPGNQAEGLSQVRVTNETPDTTPPEVESLAVSSNPGSDQTYAAGDEIEVTVTFSETVEVEGAPQLRLRVGSRTRTAGYRSGTGTATLVFGYEVADGDEDTGGVSIEAGRISLNRGTIEDEAENAAELAHEALAAQAGHQVDGVRPSFLSAAVDGSSLTLTYGEALDGRSRPASGDFTVEVGGSGRSASGVSVSGSVVTLTLNPAVEHGDTGIRVSYTVPTGVGANPIQDEVGNDARGLSSRSVTNTTGAPNTAPEITSPSSFDVPENQLVVRRLAARDTDPGDEVTGWEIVGGADQGQFTITSDTGDLSFRTAPDFEGPGDNEYLVTVEVKSGAGARELEAERTFTIRVTDEREPPEVPEAPVISGETADSLEVTWSEPDNTGPAITDYDVQYREKGTGRFIDGDQQGPGRTLTLSDLEPGTVYEVQVRAKNDEGTSGWSDAGEGRTVTPLTVGMASGTEPPVSGPFTVRFSFSEPVTGFTASDIETGQDPECRDDQNNPVFCDPGIGGLQTADDRVFTTTVTPQTNRVAHSYALTLTVPGGAVRSSVGSKPNEQPEEPLEVRVAPPGVTEPISSMGLRASPGSGTVRLSWNLPSDNGGSAIIRYEVRYAAVGEGLGPWRSVEAEALGVTVGNLINGNEYIFEVRAVNALGKSGAETVMATPEQQVTPPGNGGGGGGGGLLFPPEAPAALMAMAGDGTVGLEWSPPESDGGSPIQRYEYRLKEGRGEFGEWTPIPDSAPGEVNATGYTVGGLGNGTVYVFELRAVNAAGNGQVSEAVEVVMGLDPAYWSNFRAEDLEGARLMLEAFLSGGSGDREVRFGEGLRFEEDQLDGEGEVTATRMGSYGYRYTSRTTGVLSLDHDGGEACEVRLTFTEEGEGSYVYRCGGSLVGQGSFQLSELLNRVPEITSVGPFEVEENTTRVGRLEAVDWDEEDEVTGYGIAGGADGALFAIEAETGELRFQEAPDYENPADVESEEPQSGEGDNEYIVVVEVSSGEGERERTREQGIRVRVSDVEMEEAGEDQTGDDPSDFTAGDLEGERLTLRLTGEEGTARRIELRFGEGNRFEQTESGGQQAATRSEGSPRSGTYAYEKTGPGMGTLRLDYDDGASCEIRLSFTESGVGAFAYDCGGGDPAEGSFRLTTGSLFVPVILSSAGRNQAFFTSELTLTNRGDQEVKLDYTYTAKDDPGRRSGKASDVLAAGRQVVETDALAYLQRLGIPIPERGNRIGTLRVEVELGSEVEAVVRTTTMVPDGRAGLAYLGVAEEAGFSEPVYLCGLRQNAQDRSNVAFQNMGAPGEGAITVRTTVYSGESTDTNARVLEDIELEPGGFHQYSGLLGRLESVEGNRQGYVKVERVKGTAPFYAYGVINDQANSDGSFVFPVAASWLEGTAGQTLPVVVETSAFTSELTVTNFSEDPRNLDFQFVAEGIEATGNAAGFSMRLEAGRQEIVADVVDELRRRGVAGLGSGSRALAGAVFATAVEGDMSGIVIGARTGSEGGGGQYSVFYNAVPFGEAFSREAWVEGLQQNQENRSNLALVNTGEVDDSESVFHLEIYDGETGLLAETVVTKPIPARRWHQINGILGSYAPETRQGYIRIEKVSGENPFLAYGVVNDGGAPGERSGDGAYLPARE